MLTADILLLSLLLCHHIYTGEVMSVPHAPQPPITDTEVLILLSLQSGSQYILVLLLRLVSADEYESTKNGRRLRQHDDVVFYLWL